MSSPEPYTPKQLIALANEPTEEEGGMRDADWMIEATIALKSAAAQLTAFESKEAA